MGDAAVLLGRVLIALLFLGGAVQKWTNPGAVEGLLAGMGLPEGLVWPALVFNLLAGIALIAGVQVRAVALIVKMDDVGLRMAAGSRTAAARAFGRGLVLAMPKLMAFLSIVGTAAMLWVGGNIVIHGMDVLGWSWLYDQIHHLAEGAAHAVGVAAGFVEWAVTAF
ncbi:MAG: DUF808 family protein, partial [Paracoccaceae bacterium]